NRRRSRHPPQRGQPSASNNRNAPLAPGRQLTCLAGRDDQTVRPQLAAPTGVGNPPHPGPYPSYLNGQAVTARTGEGAQELGPLGAVGDLVGAAGGYGGDWVCAPRTARYGGVDGMRVAEVGEKRGLGRSG